MFNQQVGYTTCACSTAFTANLYHRRVNMREMSFITEYDDRKKERLTASQSNRTR